MRLILKGFMAAGLFGGLCTLVSAASMTMTGAISDSSCGASHAKMTSSHAGLTDKACTLACIKNGAKYVFVSGGKVYSIENQTMGDLAKEAGGEVSLTGDFTGDKVTVAKVTSKK